MRPNRRDTPDDEAADDVGRRVLTLIGQQVLQALGEPPGLRGIQVRKLWENRYRANVVVGPDIINSAVAHSYFVVADAAGTIVTATPALTRRY